MLHVKVAVLSYIAVLAGTLSIGLAPTKVRADGFDPTVSLPLPVQSDTQFVTVTYKDILAVGEFVAEKSNGNTPTWDWRLAGVIIGTNQRLAVFARVGRTRSVPEGKEIDGWIVNSVERGSVTLSAAGQTRVVHLEDMSDDEATEVERRRADEIARVNAPVLATSRQQDMEREEAMHDLAEATRRMTMPH